MLYADDRPDNVVSFLQGVTSAGILPEHLVDEIVLRQVGSVENVKKNHEILHLGESLVEIHYATLMNQAIEGIQAAEEAYDLIVLVKHFHHKNS
jgi:hypothetical protein